MRDPRLASVGVTRTRLVLIPATLVLAAGLALTGCGSSKTAQLAASQSASTGSTPTDTSVASPPASSAAPAPPTLVPASALPAVSGKQGAKPTIAKATAAAPTTLEAHDVIVGTGATFAYGDSGQANYTLVLYKGGTPVQSSYDGGTPFAFSVPGQLIPGFSQGVLGMKVGGRRELVIPPDLGYGPTDQNGIPGGSTLIFVVDLVSVGA